MSKTKYWCMACPATFGDADTANAHHDETGHNQTHRSPASRLPSPAVRPGAEEPRTETMTLTDEVRAKVPPVILRAADEVARLCAGRGRMTHDQRLAGREWTMCVPRRDDDSDSIFTDLIEAAAQWEREVSRLAAERDRVRGALEEIVGLPLAEEYAAQTGAEFTGRVAFRMAQVAAKALGATPDATTRREG